MRLLSLALGFVLGVMPLAASAACTTGKCTDPTAVETVRGLIAAACDCAGQAARKPYEKCAKDVVKNAVLAGNLPRECRAGVMSCEMKSNCGLPKRAICCVAGGRRGRVKARLMKRGARCPGEMCEGAMALAEACDANAACRQPRRRVRAFKSIQKVFQTSCALASCHSAYARQGGLVLDSEDVSYASMVGQPAHLAAANGMPLVDPGNPSNSFLLKKLRGEGPGDRMPQGTPPLPDAVVTMIEQWIARGAQSTARECAPGASPSVCESDETPIGDYVWQPQAPLPAPAANEGTQLFVPRKDVPSGTEWETCYAFKPDWAAISANMGLPEGALPTIREQIYRMHDGSHHLLLYAYTGEFGNEFKEGFFDCFAGTCLNPDECPHDIGGPLKKIPIGGTQVAGTRYEVKYPEGVGIPVIGKNAVIIANLHYNNPFQPPQDIYSEAWINLYFHKPNEVKAVLDGIFAVNYSDLFIEPFQTRTISRVWQPRSILGGGATDAAVFQLFGHMHKRGTMFRIDYVNGHCSTDGRACGRDDDCQDGQTCAQGPGFEDSMLYLTTAWDHAPVTDYPPPYLRVNKDEGLRWTCTHTNGVAGDPTRPPKKCHPSCNACGWDEASRTCIFQNGVDLGFHQPPAHVYQEGEPMPIMFGELADDDMCNMFGYFIRGADLEKLGQ